MHFKPIDELTLADNFMFCHTMKNEDLYKELLEKILHIKIDHRNTFKNLCKENKNIELNDKTTKIIFNSTAYEKEKNVDIKNFLMYIKTQEATDDFTTRLNSFVQKAKQNQELRSYYLSMNIHDSDIRREALKEGIEQGISQGAEQKAIETAKNLILKNIPLETIAECTGLDLEKVESLKEKM